MTGITLTSAFMVCWPKDVGLYCASVSDEFKREFAGVYYSYISLANRFVSRDNETYIGWGLVLDR